MRSKLGGLYNAENVGLEQRIRVVPELAVCLRVRSGSEVEWWAHNPQVAGSKPASENCFCLSASLTPSSCSSACFLHQHCHFELPCTASSIVLPSILTDSWKQAQICLSLDSHSSRPHTPILSSILQWSQTGTRELAAIAPDAATAGTPMPGNVESPHTSSPARHPTHRFSSRPQSALTARGILQTQAGLQCCRAW